MMVQLLSGKTYSNMNYIKDKIDIKQITKKNFKDKLTASFYQVVTFFCASIIIFIVIFISAKGLSPFFEHYTIGNKEYSVDLLEFLSGNTWYISPATYGIGFVILNTFYIVFFATLLASPISVLTALFISKIAPKKIARGMESVVELLASIPSIIYGVFGVGVIAVLVNEIASFFGYQSAGGISTLSTILVLTIMIIPSITMLSITSINAVKKDVIDGSLALGASNTQTNFRVVLTSAKSGIFSGIILGVGRALGEATAISMVVGNSGEGPNFNFFETTRTLTSTMLLGFKETSGLDYDIRFSVGFVLIIIILITNLSLHFLQKKIGGIE